jgi:biotin transporter BioY
LLALCGFLLRYITQAIIINVSARHFKERRFYLSIVMFDIVLPLISLFAMTENSIRKKHAYQWK